MTMDKLNAAISGRRLRLPSYRSMMLPIVILGIAAVLFYRSIAGFFDVWSSVPGYSHGFLIAGLSVWLTVRAVRDAAPSRSRADWILVPMLAFTGCAWLLSVASATRVVELTSFIVVVYLCFLAYFGIRHCKTFAFPLGVNLFAVPVWGFLNPPLKEATIAVNAFLLHRLGVSAAIDGDFVHIPAGTFEIEAGCAGAHYFLVAIMLASIFAYLRFRRLRSAVMLVGVAAVLAAVSNWIRVVTIIIAGDLTDMQHFLVRVDHYYFGWVLFVGVMLILTYAARLIARTEGQADGGGAVSAGNSAPSSAGATAARAVYPGSPVYALVVAIVAISPPLAHAVYASSSAAADSVPVMLPAHIGDWEKAVTVNVQRSAIPYFPGAHSFSLAQYSRDRSIVTAYVNKYLRQQEGAELVGYGNRWFDEDWRPVDRVQTDLYVSGTRHNYTVVRIRGGIEDRLVAYSYAVGKKLSSREGLTKLRMGFRALAGRRAAGAIAVSVSCAAQCEDARADLEAFLGEFTPLALDALLVGSE